MRACWVRKTVPYHACEVMPTYMRGRQRGGGGSQKAGCRVWAVGKWFVHIQHLGAAPPCCCQPESCRDSPDGQHPERSVLGEGASAGGAARSGGGAQGGHGVGQGGFGAGCQGGHRPGQHPHRPEEGRPREQQPLLPGAPSWSACPTLRRSPQALLVCRASVVSRLVSPVLWTSHYTSAHFRALEASIKSLRECRCCEVNFTYSPHLSRTGMPPAARYLAACCRLAGGEVS